MSTHADLSGLDLHEPYHYVQETDPGAVGSNKYWLTVSTGIVRRRNNANSAWAIVSAGTTTFLGLSDAPNSYVGQAGKGVRVNVGETDLEFFVVAAGGELTFVSPPLTSESTGTTGQTAIDATWFYICRATDTWIKMAHREVDTVFTYVSDGDTNGIFYWLGTQGLTVSWANPDTGGFIDMVTSTPDAGANPNLLVDRTSNNFNTTSVANSFIGFDLGSGESLKVSGYSLRNRAGFSTESIRNWKLQGTNSVSANSEAGFNAATWTDLDTRVANATLASAAQWGFFTVTPTTFYRYLRILQNGLNSSSTNHLCLGEFEFYGTFGT